MFSWTTRYAIPLPACLTLWKFLPFLLFLPFLPACQTTPTIRVIPADKLAIRLEPFVPYVPSVPGWFVPDARMLEILERGLLRTNLPTR